MRLPAAALFTLTLLLLPAPIVAQDPRQLFDLFRGELDRQIDRQRRRQQEREHHEQQQESWNALLVQWRLCFDQGDVSACDAALAYSNLAPNDRHALMHHRQSLMDQQARRDAEAAEQERQARWAAEAAERRAEEERRQAELARQRAEEDRRARELAERRAQELARQRAEEDRRAREVAERRAEEHRLATLRAFTSALDDCRRYVIKGCDAVIGSSLASAEDRTRAQQSREAAIAFATHRTGCQAGTAAACQSALSSPAMTDDLRPELEAWWRAASPWYRAADYVHDLSARSVAAVMALPTSTMVTGGVAMVLAAMVGIMARRRPTPSPAPQAKIAPPSRRRWLLRRLKRALIATRIWWRKRLAPEAKPLEPSPAAVSPPIVVATAAPRPRDPETALAALELAHAYLTEVDERIDRVFGDPDAAVDVLNTLSLASKQLADAERADPSATLPTHLDDGRLITHTQPKLKALALYFEAVARSREKPRHALSILAQAAALDPENDRIPFTAGVIHSELLQKGPAIAAFERALALDPRNINYRKELARAQSISGAEIAYNRAAKGVRTTVNVARWAILLFWVALLGSCTVSVVRINTATSDHEQREALLSLVVVWGVLALIGLFRRSILRMKLWVRENTG